jgi:LPXTG-motif cell wall-anchored protein
MKAMLFAIVGLAVAGSGGLVIWHRHRNLFADPQAGPHHP